MASASNSSTLKASWGDSQGIVLAVVQQDRVQTVTPGEGVRPDDRGGVGDLGGDQVDTVGKPVGQVGDGDRPHVLKPDLLDILPDLRPGLVGPCWRRAPRSRRRQWSGHRPEGSRSGRTGRWSRRRPAQRLTPWLLAISEVPQVQAGGASTVSSWSSQQGMVQVPAAQQSPMASISSLPSVSLDGEGADRQGEGHTECQKQRQKFSHVFHILLPHSTAAMVNTTVGGLHGADLFRRVHLRLIPEGPAPPRPPRPGRPHGRWSGPRQPGWDSR